MSRRWTQADVRCLVELWEERRLSVWAIAEQLDRTAQAVSRKGLALGLRGGRHGLVTIFALARDTGYASSTIQRVIRALGMIPRPIPTVMVRGGASPRTRFWCGIDEELVPRVLAALAKRREGAIIIRPGIARYPHGAWGIGALPPACVDCGRSDRPRKAFNLCRGCYDRRRAGKAPPADPSPRPGTVGPCPSPT